MKENRLIASQASGRIYLAIGASCVIEIFLGTNHEKGHMLIEAIQAAKIDISSIHDIESSRFDHQLVEDGDIVDGSFGNADKTRDIAPQVHQGMQFDRSLASAKVCPREEGKAEVDSCRIQDVGRLFEFEAELFVGVKVSGNMNQPMSKIRINSPIPFLVGIGQGASGDVALDAGMIEFWFHGSKTGLDVSETFSIGELSEGHAEKLIETREGSDTILASIVPNTFVEFVSWQEIHEL